MYLYKLIVFLAALLALSSAYIQSQDDDLQAEETSITHTRQKRAPILLKKLLVGGLLAKKALVIGGGVVGGAVGAKLGQKWSHGDRTYPAYNNQNPSYPIYQERPPVYYNPGPPPVRPVVYYEQYPSAPVAPSPSIHYGPPVYINPIHSRPQPQLPSVNPDCYTGISSFNPSYNPASNNVGYA